MVTLNHGKYGSSARITLATLQSIIPEQLLFVRSTTLADKGCVGWNGMGWKDGTEIDVCSRIVKKQQVYSYIPDHRTICGESQPLRIPPRPCDDIILRARGVPSDQYPSYYGNTAPLTHSLAHMQAQEQESCSCTSLPLPLPPPIWRGAFLPPAGWRQQLALRPVPRPEPALIKLRTCNRKTRRKRRNSSTTAPGCVCRY